MSRETLLNATRKYLECEKRLVNSAEVLERPRLREEMSQAKQILHDELHAAAHELKRDGAIRHVMVAVDNAAPSEWAVDRAVRLAEELGARITLVHVLDLTPVALPELAFYEAEARRALETAARTVLRNKAALVPPALLAEQILREGNVPKQIIEAAEQHKADLLVVGTHGHGPVARFLLGSTAEAVLRHARCPVLTVGQPCHSETEEPATEMEAVGTT